MERNINLKGKKDSVSASTSINETPKGKVSCLLCRRFISYKNSDRTIFHDHLANEHDVKFDSDVILAISVMTANEKQHIIQCAMDRLNEISNDQIPVSGESLLPNLLDSFNHSDSELESFHGFTDSEIESALRSLRGRAVLEDAETDAIEAGAEEVNVIDEESGLLEFVSPDNDLVTESFHGFTDMEIRSALGRGRRKRSHSRESRNSKRPNTNSDSALDGVETDTSDTEPDVKLEPYELTEQSQCNTCGKGFKTKKDLSVHIRSNHLLQETQCHQCGKCFQTRKALENHVNSFHKWVKCDSCEKYFKAGGIWGHRLRCKTYHCSECDFATKIKRELISHKKTSHYHHQQQKTMSPKKCSICPFETRHASSLRTHIANVHGARHACDLCDKQFAKQKSLDRHKRDFHGPRHSCEQCDKKFVRHGSLERHVRCQHRMDRIYSREGHMLLYRTEKVIEKPKKLHYCPYEDCNYKSSRRWGLSRHVYYKHRDKPATPEPNKTCEKCNYRFTRVSNYKAHSRKCKVKLRKQMGPEDCINLMRSRDVNFCDIKAFEMMTKKLFGRNAVEKKMRDVLSNAVKDYQRYFSVETVLLERKKRDGTIEKFKTGVSFCSNINNFADLMLRIWKLDPSQVNWLVELDGGQGSKKSKTTFILILIIIIIKARL